VIFFMPEMGGYFLEHPNFDPADSLKTPPHIAPVWYFTPFYAMLRAVPSFAGTQVWGVIVMFAAIIVLFFLPWLDRSPVKSIRYRGLSFKLALAAFVISFLILGYLGALPTTPARTSLAQICTIVYFAFFAVLPILPAFEKTKPVPERVTEK
jgi:ubiquinol-cytochrome c reductase cytochrome b subunit